MQIAFRTTKYSFLTAFILFYCYLFNDLSYVLHIKLFQLTQPSEDLFAYREIVYGAAFLCTCRVFFTFQFSLIFYVALRYLL